MKVVLPLLLLSFGCGRVDVSNSAGTSLGTVRSLDPATVDSAERARLASICNAIAQKTTNLPNIVNQSFLFNYSQKNCGNVVAPPQDANVTLIGSGSSYTFRNASTNQSFVFPEVETTTSGSMAKICAGLSTLQNPMAAGNGNYVWISTNPSSKNCASSATHYCVQLETGIPVTGSNTFKIISTEWIKFIVQSTSTQNLVGFYTERRNITNAFCSGSQFSDTTATMK